MSSGSKISIAMAVYNGDRFIGEQLESFVRQTRLPDELVVSDNASTDRTVEIVRDFAARAPFPVRLYNNDSNLGVTKNFERAIRECSGDTIFLSDCDDVWYADKILRMELTLTGFPEAVMVICDAHLVDEHLTPLGRRLWQEEGYHFPAGGRAYLSTGQHNFPHSGNCMAFRARLKHALLPLPEGSIYRYGYHDSFLCLVAISSGLGQLAVVPAPLLSYRQHAAQMVGCARTSVLDQLRRSWSARRNRSSLSELMEAVINRVEQFDPDAVRREPVLIHWRARIGLPEKRLARLPVIARELLTLRYHHFSNGVRTAARDLLFVE